MHITSLIFVKVDTSYLVCSRSTELMQSMVLYSLNRSLKVRVRVKVNVSVPVPVPVDTSYLVCSRSTELM